MGKRKQSLQCLRVWLTSDDSVVWMSVSIIQLHLATCGLTVFTPLPKHNHILEKGFFVALWWWCWSCSRTAPAALWSAPAKTDSARGGRCGHFWECTSAPRSAPAARGVWDCWGAGGHFLVPQGNIYRKRAKNICFRLLIGRSGAGATGNPEWKNKNLMTLSSRLMFGLYLRKCCNTV